MWSARVQAFDWSTVFMAFLGLVSDRRLVCSSENVVMAKWPPACLRSTGKLVITLCEQGLEVPIECVKIESSGEM